MLVILLSPAGAAEALWHRQFPASPQTILQLTNRFGMIRVRRGGSPQIDVQARKVSSTPQGLDRIQIDSYQLGDQVQVDVRYTDEQDRRASVLLEVRVPAGVSVQARSEEGTIWVEGNQGVIQAVSTSGDIQLFVDRPLASPIKAESDRGNIRLQLAAGSSADVFASSGTSISLNGQTRIPGGYSTFKEKILGGKHQVSLRSRQGPIDLSIADSHTAPQVASAPPPVQAPVRAATTVAADVEPPRRGGPPVLQTGREAPDPTLPIPSTASSPGATGPTATSTTDPPVNPNYTMRGSSVDVGYTISMKVEFVNLNVSVRDRSNRSVASLRKENFEVLEDGAPQPIEKFQPERTPFNLLLLLDVSGSTSSFMDLIKEASINFTRQINPQDRIAVAIFNNNCHLIADFTNDRSAINNAIMGIRSGGGTAVYDALDTSITEYMRNIEGRKAVVLFSDGLDNRLDGTARGSDISFDELFRRIQEIDTVIYPIFLETENGMGRIAGGSSGAVIAILGDILRGGTSGGGRRGGGAPSRWPTGDKVAVARREMQEIADQTGGRMYNPQQVDDLRGAYAEIADDLRIQYSLGYTSTNPAKDGAWRRIQVRIAGRSDLAARTRKGYYARKP